MRIVLRSRNLQSCPEHSEGVFRLEKCLLGKAAPDPTGPLGDDSQPGSDLKPKRLETNPCLCSQWGWAGIYCGGGNRWEEKPYVTIDFLLLLLPFSILTGNLPTLAQHTKVSTKDPLRITTHARLAFITPLMIPTQKPPSKGFSPASPSLRVPI